MTRALASLLLATSLAAGLATGCGAASTPIGPAGVAPGQPITAPRGTWTWTSVDGAVCDDGTPTGIGVYLTDSPNLIVYLEGGGACWDYSTCFQLNTSVHGPFGPAQFAQRAASLGAPGTVFSEADAATFKGWNKVYVPYCTGDVHGGDAVQTYTSGGLSGTVHHVGYHNVTLALARIVATVPTPARLVWTGSSAGGFGATFNYTQGRATFPGAKAYLIDDSGPVFVDAGINDFLKNGWIASWGLANTLFKLCPDCVAGDFSLAYPTMARTFPADRMALLSSLQDQVIRSYLLLQPAIFQGELEKLTAQRFDGSANLRYFLQAGETHTMLGDEPSHTTGGVNVADWIGKMVGDDASWGSVKP